MIRQLITGTWLAIGLCAVIAAPAGATTHTVQAGESIQTAINGASSGDVVEVAAGTFMENITLKRGVQLVGAGPELTTLDGDRAGEVISVENGAEQNTTIEGFRITGGFGYWSGGIYVQPGASPLISDCLIENNDSQNYGGGIYVGEGGSPTVEYCTIRDNTAHEGGGIYYQGHWSGGAPTIQFNIICNNTGSVSSGGIHIALCRGTAMLTNNSIANNTSGGWGSGISVVNSIATITNNIIAFNDGDAGFYVQGSLLHNGCNLVYGNQDVEFEGLVPGEGTLMVDPLFCDPSGCELTVGGSSPALEQGTCGLIGALPMGCDFTSVEATSWGGVKSIFR